MRHWQRGSSCVCVPAVRNRLTSRASLPMFGKPPREINSHPLVRFFLTVRPPHRSMRGTWSNFAGDAKRCVHFSKVPVRNSPQSRSPAAGTEVGRELADSMLAGRRRIRMRRPRSHFLVISEGETAFLRTRLRPDLQASSLRLPRRVGMIHQGFSMGFRLCCGVASTEISTANMWRLAVPVR